MLICSPYPFSLYSFFREVQWGLTLEEEEGRFTVIRISVANFVENMQKLKDFIQLHFPIWSIFWLKYQFVQDYNDQFNPT